MSAYQDLASPAPQVETAIADAAKSSGSLRVDAAAPSEAVKVEPAKRVEPAVLVDNPKKFAPALTRTEASHLSVAALRRSGADFESEVKY